MRAPLTREGSLRRFAALALCVAAAALLSACETEQDARQTYRDTYRDARYTSHDTHRDASPKLPSATYYTVVVHRGDTMARIAARYSTTSDQLARANNISTDATLHPGDVLHVPPTRGAREAVMRDATNNNAAYAPATDKDRQLASEDPALAPRTISKSDRVVVRSEPDITPRRPYAPASSVSTASVQTHSGDALASGFVVPVSGTIVATFGMTNSGERNDGINIAAATGTPIRAAADGVVTYAGNELKSYGNLILIKHGGEYVTAYAHTNTIGVARGQRVAKGDVIGTVGQTGDVDRPQLHFEIRRGMKPIDPRPLVMAAN